VEANKFLAAAVIMAPKAIRTLAKVRVLLPF
jgi:hypothetical protein